MDLGDKNIPFYILLLHLLFSIASGEFRWYSSLHKPWCYVKECCNEKWVPKDYQKLRDSLKADLFGQHLVEGAVYGALKGHATHQSGKPLVLSFHGTTGTGKNYVSQLISRSWFRKGRESKYVHFLSGTKDFPFKSKIDEYTIQLQRLIESETRKCKNSLFIFDEIDSFPQGLLNSIRSYMEYHTSLEGVDYRNTIFLFLSNTGGAALKDLTEKFYSSGNSRKDIKLVETERAMIMEIYSKKDTGLRHSSLIDANLISHFVPFLPLERSHVRECIAKEMNDRHIFASKDIIEEVIDELQFTGLEDNFSAKGCKNVAEKVSLVSINREFDPFSGRENEHQSRDEF